mmetsp:Transcript_2053/g.4415  ORF Transcript_2053/g.4415 Transcript_2053/m.4415 type:complete len:116 (+) Transcript_2053:48-395(+)
MAKRDPNPQVVRNFNHDMLTGINYLKEKKEVLAHEIEREAEECSRLKDEITSRSEQLEKVQKKLQLLMEKKDKITQTIEETEEAYKKIEESSRTLLHVLKRESKSFRTDLEKERK